MGLALNQSVNPSLNQSGKPATLPGKKNLICLTGFMGSGKSTIGLLLAKELGWPFTDLDREIEAAQGRTIREIFETEGEPHFRNLEHAALGELVRRQPNVIALGGGTIIQKDNRDLIREAGGTSVWLDGSPEALLARCAGVDNRPLFSDKAGFLRLLEERRPEYRKADFKVETDGVPPEQVVEGILRLPFF